MKSIRYRGTVWKVALTLFAIAFLILGYCGSQPPDTTLTMLARIFAVVYFGFFLLMPFYTSIEKTKPVPDRVGHQTVVIHGAGESKSAVAFGEVDKARMQSQ